MSGAPPGAVALVGRSLTEFGRMLGWLAPLAALGVLAPEGLDRALRAAHLRGPAADAAVIGTWVVLGAFQLTAATSRALSRLRGERPRLHETLRTAARRLVPVALASALCAAAVLAGLAVLVAPGVVALASVAVAPAVAAGERGGPWRAVVRSLDLTRGYRGRALAALALLSAIAAIGVAVAGASLSTWNDAELVALAGISTFHLFASLPAVGTAVVYEALREAKEAPREADLARVFG